jgi:4-amino-4-deoxy-L-arabinose transferase-like glycosyltransferase
MKSRTVPFSIAFVLVVSTLLLYGWRLEDAPPHLEVDEVLIALDAHAVATTGRDVRGEWLPLYFPVGATSWYQPAVIYLTAAVLKIAPLSERSIRLPTIGVAAADVALIYFVARSLFASELFGALAAVLLALTPGHFIHARYGMDYLYPVPFALAWLLCLVAYVRQPRDWVLALGMSVLGVGFYSYIASMAMMPLYFLFTCLVLYVERAAFRTYRLAAVSFFPWLLPFVWWLARHPRAFDATITKYALFDVQQLDAVQGLRSLVSYASVSDRLSRYWNFFNPAFLFFGSGIKMPFSTNLVGVFLFSLAILAPIGLYVALKRRVSPLSLVVCLGFAAAPLAAAIVAEQNAIFRGLTILPFGVLLATMGLYCLWWLPVHISLRPLYLTLSVTASSIGLLYGAWTLLTQSRLATSPIPLVAFGAGVYAVGRWMDRVKRWRIVAVALLALVPLQFGLFLSDYFSAYRTRSAPWLGGNVRGALEEIIAREAQGQVPYVYLSPLATAGQVDERTTFTDAYWQFYLAKHHRTELLARTRRFEPAAVEAIPTGSLILASAGDKATDALVERGALERVKIVPELDGAPLFVVLRR